MWNIPTYTTLPNLIESPNVYTGESLKAYKSIDAYNYFVSGWLEIVTVVDYRLCKKKYLPDYCSRPTPPKGSQQHQLELGWLLNKTALLFVHIALVWQA